MNAPLDITPETAELLARRAKASGLSVDEYLKTLVGKSNGTQGRAETPVDELVEAMESLAEEKVEPLPDSFSREEIYFPKE